LYQVEKGGCIGGSGRGAICPILSNLALTLLGSLAKVVIVLLVVGCCYPFLGSHKKKLKMRKYKKIYQNIFERNPKNNRCEKRTGMLKKRG
jgi:hypothetical protein